MKSSRKQCKNGHNMSRPEFDPKCLPCPHHHFGLPGIDRDKLSPEEHISYLATPRGYRWHGNLPTAFTGPKAFSLLKPVRKRERKKIEGSDQRYIHQFLSQVFPLFSPEMITRLKRMLIVEFGMSSEEAEAFLRSLDSKETPSVRNVVYDNDDEASIKSHWLKEFEILLTAKITDYIVSMMCAQYSQKATTIAEHILSHLCDVTGEWCDLEKPKNRMQRINVFLAKILAIWLGKLLRKVNMQICDEFIQKPPTETEKKKKKKKKPKRTPPQSIAEPSKQEIEDQKQKELEEKRRKEEEEKRRKEEEERRRQEEEEKRRKEEEEKRLKEKEEKRRQEEEAKRRKEEEERRLKEEEEKRLKEEEERRLKEEEEKRRKEEEEKRLKEEEEKRLKEEEEKLRQEEEKKRRKEEEEKRLKEEEEKRRQEEEAKRRKEEEERRLKEEEEKRRQEEEEKRLKEEEEKQRKEEEEEKRRKEEEEEKRRKEEEEKLHKKEEKPLEDEEEKKPLEEEEEEKPPEEEEEEKPPEEEEEKEETIPHISIKEETHIQEDEREQSALEDLYPEKEEVVKPVVPPEPKAPIKPLDVVENWIDKTTPVESDKQKVLGDILEKEIKEVIGDSLPVEEEQALKSIAEKTSTFIETIKTEAEAKLSEPKVDTILTPPSEGKVTYLVKKVENECYYKVKQINEKELCERTRVARFKTKGIFPESLCVRPSTAKSTSNLNRKKEWTKWAIDVVNFAEKWSSWISNTTSEAEEKKHNKKESGENKSWIDFRKKAEMYALELKRNKMYVKETSKKWTELLRSMND